LTEQLLQRLNCGLLLLLLCLFWPLGLTRRSWCPLLDTRLLLLLLLGLGLGLYVQGWRALLRKLLWVRLLKTRVLCRGWHLLLRWPWQLLLLLLLCW
jgi:hypothetical protein